MATNVPAGASGQSWYNWLIMREKMKVAGAVQRKAVIFSSEV
jgi:hypothetical protein